MEKLVEKLVLWNWRITAALTVSGLGMIAVFWKKIPPEVPMLYTRPWGQDQLVPPWSLWALPLFGLAIGLLMGIWGNKRGGNTLLKIICLASGLVAQAVVAIGLSRIIFLIT